MTKVTGDWLSSHATQSVFDAMENAGHSIFVVGGCVRNALLGVPVTDVDMSTSALPEQTIAAANAAGMRAIPTGIDHGTVTVLAENEPFEITTYRMDVETDGRRAVVAFADSPEADAHRRDFTINALYADRKGQVTDFVGGLRDIDARRLRFIDDAEARIKEDYLRTLRYFRFFAWYGDARAGLDPEALAAIAANTDGLATLSKERVTSELTKMFSADDPAMSVASMVQTGVSQAVLAGGDLASFQRYLHWEGQLGIECDAIVRMASFSGAGTVEALRLSRSDARKMQTVVEAVGHIESVAATGYKHGSDVGRKVLALRAAMLEQHLDVSAAEEIDRGASQVFPLTAKDLMPKLEGPALGQALRDCEAKWIASDFVLDREAFLDGL